jgi:uncharacterized OsmC-like protein
MPPEAKEFRYAMSQDAAGRIVAEGSTVELGEAWTPEHLVLAGLVRCTLQSLRFHVTRAGGDFRATATAAGRVTKREEDDRYAFVELEVDLDVELEPAPSEEELRELLAKAERDCFVSASLRPSPAYRWRVNGREVASGS